ncbi:hypothetical protein KEM56_002276 [Ascosphaera pollenicola]|nr:hypothetical protein KEM56_002276 [Ascosphaera pollenicola]
MKFNAVFSVLSILAATVTALPAKRHDAVTSTFSMPQGTLHFDVYKRQTQTAAAKRDDTIDHAFYLYPTSKSINVRHGAQPTLVSKPATGTLPKRDDGKNGETPPPVSDLFPDGYPRNGQISPPTNAAEPKEAYPAPPLSSTVLIIKGNPCPNPAPVERVASEASR